MRDDVQFSAGGIVLLRSRILLIEARRTRRWQLPKGHVERGESPRQAAMREILEETGAAVTVIEPAGEIEYRFRGSHGRWIFKHVDFFLCEFAGQTSDRCDPHEVMRAEWHGWDRALELLAFSSERDLVRRSLERVEHSQRSPMPSSFEPAPWRFAEAGRSAGAIASRGSSRGARSRLDSGTKPGGDIDGPEEIP
ncbi:MAG TPA: NUDIX domain-containing protein [Thermoanaerobaculia bacterium]|nr:NUDIX domain-containing protein [Thermoanaerobaculia bacterium]